MEQYYPLISLVIPVYNVEKYLRKCLNSVLAQTYDNFEVILVDDGSTDTSGKICDEYAQKDSRITVYHKQNGGLSDARNFGVEHCNADLVSFIDSDDYVTEDYLEYLWHLMKKYESDISSANYYRVKEDYVENYNNASSNVSDYSLSKSDAMTKLLYGTHGFGTSACIKLYKKELLKKFPFPFRIQPEDVAVIYKMVWDSNKVAIGTKSIYRYVQRQTSYVHSLLTDEKTNNLIKVICEMENYVKHVSPKSIPALYSRCCMLLSEYMPSTLNDISGTNNFNKLQLYLKEYYKFFKMDKNVSMLSKIKYKILLLDYNTCKKVFPIAEYIRWYIKERKKR